MNVTGTERQRAVIAAYRMKPKARPAEIAQAAGVSLSMAQKVIREYRESKAHDDACLPVCTTSKPAERDVACFAVDRRLVGRFDVNFPYVSHTAKQENMRIALAEHPQEEGETKMKYCRRIAAIAGVSDTLVHAAMEVVRCEQIGAALRAKQAAEAGTKLVPFSVGVGPVQNFTGWLDVFHKFQVTAVAYLLLAQSRKDVYATAYLKDIRDKAENAATRATMDLEG
jgi:hypothetical protein